MQFLFFLEFTLTLVNSRCIVYSVSFYITYNTILLLLWTPVPTLGRSTRIQNVHVSEVRTKLNNIYKTLEEAVDMGWHWKWGHVCNVAVTLQSPIFGYLWGTSIPWFRVPRGYPFRGGEWAPYQYHGTVECKTHTIPHSYQYHVTYHTIPYHLTSYHTIRGVWGPFTKYEKYFYRLQYVSIGLHLLWTGSLYFCCHFKP